MTALKDLALSHFAASPVRDVFRGDQQDARPDKPRGLWVSVDGDDDWEKWCISEEFRLERLAVRHRVTLSANCNVLHLTTPGEVFAFGKEYSTAAVLRWHRGIDWLRVAGKHDGIVIAPYQWGCWLHENSIWYYGWDCASGCIWEPRAIASIEVVLNLLRDVA